ncbi:MAG: type II secretion system GspH family protein [Gemmatimonadaceae bacterium]|nr:type II secretion system GspH family protein [Gemmatimonadaceae bacterium]
MLLESLVALALAGIASLALLGALREASHTLTLLEQRRTTLVAADRFLAAVSLWTREDLDRRLGARPQGPFILTIAAPTTALYEVQLSDAVTRLPLLSTTLYRSQEPECLSALPTDAAASRCSR